MEQGWRGGGVDMTGMGRRIQLVVLDALKKMKCLCFLTWPTSVCINMIKCSVLIAADPVRGLTQKQSKTTNSTEGLEIPTHD